MEANSSAGGKPSILLRFIPRLNYFLLLLRTKVAEINGGDGHGDPKIWIYTCT
jgi:hypothetical protein